MTGANGDAASVDAKADAAANGTAAAHGPSKEDMEKAEELKNTANELFKAKKFTEAVEGYTEAINLDPTNASYLTNRAAAYMTMSPKRLKLALADCQEASKLQSASPQPKTLIRLARCHLSLGQFSQALSVLSPVLSSLDPSNAQALQVSAHAKRVEDHLRQFHFYRKDKSWTLAGIALDKAHREVEEVPLQWRIWRADLLISKGYLSEAGTKASDILRLSLKNPDALHLRARILFLQGELGKSIAHSQEALRCDPDFAPARRLLKWVRRLEAAKEAGNEAFKAQRLDEAVEKYGDAIKLVDEGAEEDGAENKSFKAILYGNRAMALSKLGKHKEAVEDCSTALELDSGYTKALRTRARAYSALEDYEASIRDFNQAVEESVDNKETAGLKKELRQVEIDLKRSKKDYYKILGVSKDCTDTDVKKAYRRESLKHHPDKGGDEEKFKLCAEAYSVLSDPIKKRRYDSGVDDDEVGMGGAGFGGGSRFAEPMDLADLFASGAFSSGGFSSGGYGGGAYGGGGFGGGGFQSGSQFAFGGGMPGSSFAGAGGAGRRGPSPGFRYG